MPRKECAIHPFRKDVRNEILRKLSKRESAQYAMNYHHRGCGKDEKNLLFLWGHEEWASKTTQTLNQLHFFILFKVISKLIAVKNRALLAIGSAIIANDSKLAVPLLYQ